MAACVMVFAKNAPMHTEQRNPMTPYRPGKVERIISDAAHNMKRSV